MRGKSQNRTPGACVGESGTIDGGTNTNCAAS